MSLYNVETDLDVDEVYEEKSNELIELENHPEFKKLPYTEKIILITGEKLLEIDKKIKEQTSKINDLLSQYGSAISIISNNQKKFSNHIKDIVKKETLELSKKIDSTGSVLSSMDEDKIVQLIEDRYNEEINNIENRFEYTTQQTIKNLDESIYDTLEKMDDLKRFEIKAREDIQKTQDRIYVLEEEISRQKELNESMKNSIEYWSTNVQETTFEDPKNTSIINYKYYDSRFETIEDLENFIKKEAKLIAKNEVEKYIHDYNLFADDRNDELIEKLFAEDHLKDNELSKLYSLQISNNSRMTDLEKLLDAQNKELKMLSEDRQNLLLKFSDLLKNKNVDLNEYITNEVLNNNSVNNTNNNALNEQVLVNNNSSENSKILSNKEMEILIKKQAIELVQEKINYLNSQKISANNENENSSQINTEFDENNKIKLLEEKLKLQIDENNKLKESLFNVKNNKKESFEANSFINENDDNILLDEINFSNLDILDEEFMKHNYYNGSTPIPGTKITRINNYKINNDVEISNFNNDAQTIIKKEIENYEKEKVSYEKQEDDLFLFSSDEVITQEYNQKLIDLEKLISKQDEEIKKFREEAKLEKSTQLVSNIPFNELINNHIIEPKITNKETFIPQSSLNNVVCKPNEPLIVQNNSNTLNDIDESLKKALDKLNDLSCIQEKTKKEIEETNKKINELETEIKKNNYPINEFDNPFDKLTEEKPRVNNQILEQNLADQMKQIEIERRMIEETLELERIRVLSEIEANKKKIEQLNEQQLKKEENVTLSQQNEQVLSTVVPIPIVIQHPENNNDHSEEIQEENKSEEVVEKKEEIKYILESPKKKRKQQVFYEIKTHSTPKLTRADLEK